MKTKKNGKNKLKLTYSCRKAGPAGVDSRRLNPRSVAGADDPSLLRVRTSKCLALNVFLSLSFFFLTLFSPLCYTVLAVRGTRTPQRLAFLALELLCSRFPTAGPSLLPRGPLSLLHLLLLRRSLCGCETLGSLSLSLHTCVPDDAAASAPTPATLTYACVYIRERERKRSRVEDKGP